MTLEELQSGELGIGWGAIAIDAGGFAADAQDFVPLGEQPVTDEEQENVEDALNSPVREGVMSRLAGRFRRRR